jgi:TonB family protein
MRGDTVAGRFSFAGVPADDYLLKIEKTDMGLVYGAVQLRGDGVHELNPVLVPAAQSVVKAAAPFHKPATNPPRGPGKVTAARLTHKVPPIYPDSAKQLRIRGKVDIAATLRIDGTLDDLVVLSAPHPDLALAALLAVRRWRYSPTLFSGTPVEVFFAIDVNFELN